MSSAPEEHTQEKTHSWELDDKSPASAAAAASGSGWWDNLASQFRTRFEASQHAISSIPPLMILAVAAVLIVPTALGFFAQFYVKDQQRQLSSRFLTADSPVTAMWWSNDGDQRLAVGTVKGEVIIASAGGTLRNEVELGAPIVDIQTGTDGFPVPITLSARQVFVTPTGTLAQGAHSGLDTCLSGFVWREATVNDLVCVPPDVRDQSLADRAAAEQGTNTTAGCPEGLVPRNARADDTACTTEEIARSVLDQNHRDQSRKLLPDAALESTRSLDLLRDGTTVVVGERGLLAVVGNTVLAGTENFGLDQWTIEDQRAAFAGSVGDLASLRLIARNPGSPIIYAGDVEGRLFQVDGSVQVSGTNPDSYLRQLGRHDTAITEIAPAASPAAGMPSLATAAADGSVRVWWPEIDVASRALTPPVQSRDVAPIGTSWQVSTSFGAATERTSTMSRGNRAAIVLTRGDRMTVLSVEATPDEVSLQLNREVSPPYSTTANGHRSSAYDPSVNAMVVYDGLFRSPIRDIAIEDGQPLEAVLSPAGDKLAIVHGDGSVELANMVEGADTVLSLPASARYAAFNPSGTQLALGLDDGSVALVRTSDATLLEIVLLSAGIGGDAGVNILAREVRYSANGRQLVLLDPNNVAVSTYGIRMRQQSDWRQIDPAAELSSPKISADGSRLVAMSGNGEDLLVYDTRTGTQIGSISSPGLTNWNVSLDAGYIAVNTAAGGTDVFEPLPDDTATLPLPPLAEDGLRLSADGSTLLLRDAQGRLQLWNVGRSEGPQVLVDNVAPGLNAIGAEIAPDGHSVVVADTSGGVTLIDIPTGRHIGIAGHGSLVHRMLLSADGRLLASASLDGVVQVTDLERARLLGALPGVTIPVGRRSEGLRPDSLASEPPPIDPLVQQWLDSQGYGPVPSDGVLGLATRAAVARWQRERGLPPTGVPDETLLNEVPPAATTQQSLKAS